MANEPQASSQIAKTTQATVPQAHAEPLFTRVLHDLKKTRPQLAERIAANSTVLERVREYEKQTALVIQQVTLSAAKGEDIERLALLDSVSELYNHRAFIKELKAELARVKRYKHHASLVMVSIDSFDQLAQHYGPLTVDAMIRVVAGVIRSSLREVDIAAKYNQNFFAVILSQTGASGASLLGERIRQKVANQALVHNGEYFSVTASVGVASCPEDAQEYDQLIACSIEALETAMIRGGDRVVSV
jgi:diguanylate cyclase (GGDEF)-like protein